ncbi:MAG: hypothetical protein U0996_26225 [Planctomycetaceae bacterium]
MTQEIVFTSARQGLRTGSTGFCTVRSTRGMPGNLAQLLERLTSYSHVFDAYGPQASLNPVNFAHYIARLGDQRFHILARVSNAPLDHTNRSNKLAHIIAVDDSQLEKDHSEGPASESLAIPWVREWRSEEVPSVLPDAKQICLPVANQPRSGECRCWKFATKDAGWAAVLAASANEPGTTVQVILPRDIGRERETWTLELVHEALSLLPPESRWEVTYSTFFAGNLPVSIHCQWQFVLDGTDAAKRARLDPRSKVIDIPGIAAAGTPAPENSLTPLTSSGARPWDSDRAASSTARRRKEHLPPLSDQSEDRDRVELDSAEVVDHPVAPVQSLQTAGFPVLIRERTREPRRGRSSPSSTPLLLRPASLLVILLLISGLAVLLIRDALRGGSPQEFQEIVKSSDLESKKREASEEKRKREQEQRERVKKAERERNAEAEQQGSVAVVVPEPSRSDDSEPKNREKPVPEEVTRTTTDPALRPLQEVRNLHNRLELKLPASGLTSGPDGPAVLTKIHVKSPEHFELTRIIGGASVLKPGMGFFIEARDKKEDSAREWDVLRKSTTGVDLESKPHVVGTFRLDRNLNLSFRWSKGNENFEIINCLLEMKAGDPSLGVEQEKCTLRDVVRIRPVRLNVRETVTTETLLNKNQLPNTQAVELSQCEFSCQSGDVSRTGPPFLHVGDQVQFRIESKDKGTYRATAELQVTLSEVEERVQIEMKLKLGMLNSDEEPEIVFVPLTPGLLKITNEELDQGREEIQKERRKLEAERLALDNETKRAPRKSNGEIRDSELKDKIEELEKNLESHGRNVDAYESRWKAARKLADDLEKLVDDISMNGQLRLKLRLMIPDAGEQGIELLTTE